MNKLKWVILNPEYIDYLKKIDSRIPNYDYGEGHLKPFYGNLLEKDGLVYVSQVNHYKPEKHDRVPKSIDFDRIYDYKYKKFIGTTSLNYMFPVPKSQIQPFLYENMNEYTNFIDDTSRIKQTILLKKMLYSLNNLNLSNRADKVHKLRYVYPDSKISSRCLDYNKLEDAALHYQQDIDEQILTEESLDLLETIKI